MSAFELGFFAIPTTNMDAAKKFYGPVMGWAFQDCDPDFSYIFAGEKMVGALETRLKPSQHGPLLYFRADTMTGTLDRVTAQGGVVVEKQAMEDGARGYTARVLDPSQNAVAFWAPEE